MLQTTCPVCHPGQQPDLPDVLCWFVESAGAENAVSPVTKTANGFWQMSGMIGKALRLVQDNDLKKAGTVQWEVPLLDTA